MRKLTVTTNVTLDGVMQAPLTEPLPWVNSTLLGGNAAERACLRRQAAMR
jgi:hypothetical protein